MTENKFYEICDKMGETPNTITEGYFPTIDDLQLHDVEHKLDYYMPILTYFAANPYKEELKNNEEYNQMVKYVNDLLLDIKFDEKKSKKKKN